MKIVTRSIRDAKKIRCDNRKFRKELKAAKIAAHRLDRRRAKQTLRMGNEPVSIPLLTGRDLV